MIGCSSKEQFRTKTFQAGTFALKFGILLGAIATVLVPFSHAQAASLPLEKAPREKALNEKVSPSQAKQRRATFRAAESFLSQSEPILSSVTQPLVEPVEPLLAQRSSSLPNDGVYLFGQQPIPDQLQTAYLIFEAQADNIVGAFYMPHSSFDCVQGALQDTELALTITESYSQEVYNYALALDRDVAVASTGVASAVNIEGFHPIETVSDNDIEILEACKSFYDGAI